MWYVHINTTVLNRAHSLFVFIYTVPKKNSFKNSSPLLKIRVNAATFVSLLLFTKKWSRRKTHISYTKRYHTSRIKFSTEPILYVVVVVVAFRLLLFPVFTHCPLLNTIAKPVKVHTHSKVSVMIWLCVCELLFLTRNVCMDFGLVSVPRYTLCLFLQPNSTFIYVVDACGFGVCACICISISIRYFMDCTNDVHSWTNTREPYTLFSFQSPP